SRARNPRGQETASDPDWQRESQGPGDRHQSGLTQLSCKVEAPRWFRGAFLCPGGFSQPGNEMPMGKPTVFLAAFQSLSVLEVAQRHCADSCSVVLFLLVMECRRNKRNGFTSSGVDQPCVAGQYLAWSIRAAMLS